MHILTIEEVVSSQTCSWTHPHDAELFLKWSSCLTKTNQNTVTSERTLRSLVCFPRLVNLLNWPFLTAFQPEWLLSTPVKGFTLSLCHYPLLYSSSKSPQYLDKNMQVFVTFHWRKHNIWVSLYVPKYKLHENEFTY